MMRFVLSFLAIINFCFAEANASLEASKAEIKNEVVHILVDGENNTTSPIASNTDIVDIIATKVAESEVRASDNNKSDEMDETLFNIVNQIVKLNNQALILKAQGIDENSTSGELQTITGAKKFMFEKLPMAITYQKIKKENLLDYIERKDRVQKTLKKYEKKQNSKEYGRAYLEFAKLGIGEIFYGSMIKLEQMFISGASKESIHKELQGAILNLQTRDYAKITYLKENLSDEIKAELGAEFSDFENKKSTYEEILSYLLKNGDLLASNVFFTSFNLGQIIEYINSKSPAKFSSFNLGKWVLIVFITLVFYSFRKMLARVIFFIFGLLNKNKIDNNVLKTQVIDIIKKPLGVLLVAYSFDICLAIFYYPAPVPIKFANFFSIIYIVLYSWLIIEIIDGYGIMLVSSIAKKSGRKEVINLLIKMLYIVVILIALLLILKRFGFNVSAFVASLGIGGLAVALATKDIIANFFASVMLLFDNSFSQGDWVVVDSVEGTVVEIGLRKTTIRTFDNALVFVPNSTIMSQNVLNWNKRKVGRVIKLYLDLEYGTSSDTLLKCVNDIKEMLQNHPGIAKSADTGLNSKDFRTHYRQNMVSIDDLAGYKSTLLVSLDQFADSSLKIMVYCFSKTIVWAEFLEVKQDVMIKMMKIIEKNGANFAFPSQSLYIEKLPKILYDSEEFRDSNKGEKHGRV